MDTDKHLVSALSKFGAKHSSKSQSSTARRNTTQHLLLFLHVMFLSCFGLDRQLELPWPPSQAPRWGGVWLAKTEGMVLGWGIPPPYPSTPWGPTSAHLKRAEGGSGWPFEGHPLRPAPGQLLRSCPAALLQGATCL